MKNMKRFVCLLLVVAMMASLPVVASAAVTHDHVHTFSDSGKKVVAPTCDKEGYTEHKCDKCDYTYKDAYIPSNHAMLKNAKKSEVSEDHKITYTCNTCNATLFVENQVEGEDGVFAECTHSETTRNVLLSASCKSAGIEYYVDTCTICGKKTAGTKDAVTCNHNYPETYTVGTQSTFTDRGVEYRICTTCGHIDSRLMDLKPATLTPAKTKGITAVYDAANTNTKIGELPAGAEVLVKEKTDTGYCKIVAKNGESAECWVKTSNLTLGTAGNGYTPVCSHPGTTEYYLSKATCNEAQFEASKCVNCDEYWTFKKVTDAKNHVDSHGDAWTNPEPATFQIANDPAWKITKQPSETAAGEMERVCAVCGYKQKATGAAYAANDGFAFHNIAILKKLVPDNETAVVSGAEVISVYDTNETGRTVKFYAVKGTNLIIKGYTTDKSWVQIVSKMDENKDGWVKASDITVGKSGSIASSYNGAGYIGYVISGAEAKVHASADAESSVVSTLKAGSAVPIYSAIGNDTTWVRVGSASADKWIEISSLSIYKPMLYTYTVSAPTATLTYPVAEGSVTSSGALNIRKSTSVQSDKMGELASKAKVYIYEIKNVNGVQWGKVLGMKSGSNITWGKISKADLEDTSKSQVSGWVCMTYVALDTEVVAPGASANASANKTGKVTTGGIALNVRSKADVYGDKVGALPNGTAVTIYETKIGANNVQWGRISQNSLDGWVSMQYVTLDAASSSSGSAAKVNATVANCATAVNVRSKADISGAQVARIPVGTRIAVTKTENGWGYVDGKGWVFLQYVAFDAGAQAALNNNTSTGSAGSESNVTTYTAVSLPAEVTSGMKIYNKAGGTTVLMTIFSAKDVKVIDRTLVNGTLWYKISEGSVTGWTDGKVNNALGLKIKTLTGTVKTTVNVYMDHSVDSNVVTVLGAGSKFKVETSNNNENHYTEGIYAWAELSSGGWIQLHNTELDAEANPTFLPAYSTTPAIVGSVVDESGADLYESYNDTTTKLANLPKNTNVTVNNWYFESETTWGKISQGQYVGWIKLSDANAVYVEQVSVSGTASSDTLNLYKTCGSTTDAQIVLRKGDKVTVTERRLVGNSVWGRLVAEKDTKKQELWANLAGVTLDGQKTETTTAPTTPVVTPTVTTPTSVTIGVVVGNFDKVNVRQEPHVSSALVATVKKGDQVRVSEQKISDGANWGKIDQGWIAMQYVSLKSETVATNATTNVATGTTIMTSVPSGAIAAGFTSIDNLAVRSSAGVAMPQVGTLAKGSSVVISEITSANGLYWGKTDAGWICMSYVVNTAVGTSGSGTAGTIARCNYTVNVRATAGASSAITGKIMVGSPVQIFETTTYSGELWGRTNLGWVAMQYVA